MDILTRQRFDGYCATVARLNNVGNTVTTFAVAPAVEQKFEVKLKETIEFLGMINFENVIPQTAQTLGIETTRSIMGTKDTSGGNKRTPTDPTDNDETNTYMCLQTNFDWARRYDKMDAWRHKPDFEVKTALAILRQQGRDIIMAGWHGIARAASSDRVANPLLQDVAKGWLQKIRERAPAQVFDDGNLTVKTNGANNPLVEAIYVKAGVDLYDASLDNAATAEADYSSLDALVLDAKRMLPEWHRGDTDIVVVVGHDLVDEKYFQIAQSTGTTATEVEATDRVLRSAKQLGGYPAVRVPFFPADGLLITRLDNLSVYNQDGTRRRRLIDEPDYDQVANYESVNMDYVVEDFELVVLVENIVIGAAPARPAP